MQMDLDRRIDHRACVVCGASDARLLSQTRLLDGTHVAVCGSHKLAHRRSEAMARTVEELREMVGDRRDPAMS